MSATTITGIPIDVLFLSIGSLIAMLVGISAWIMRGLVISVQHVRASGYRRDLQLMRIQTALILICRKVDIPFPFVNSDNDSD